MTTVPAVTLNQQVANRVLRAIQRRDTKLSRARQIRREAHGEFAVALHAAQEEGATLRELGELLGVSHTAVAKMLALGDE